MGQSTFYKLSEDKYDFILPKIIDVVKMMINSILF